MSLRNKRNTRSGLPFSTGGYSTPKTSTTEQVAPVVVDQSLLAPVNIEVDPTVQARRTQEKEEIKGLNNRFASFINKVQLLEQEHKVLEIKWNLLQGKAVAPSEIEPFFKSYITKLEKQLDQVNNENRNLEVEHQTWLRNVEDYCKNYEDELNRRVDAENTYVLQKKDVDEGTLSTQNLQLILSTLSDEICFLKAIYDAELQELQQSIKGTCVVVEMDNSRHLNMDQAVLDIKAQYEEVAARSKEETETWYKRKFDQIAAQANQHGSELHTTKEEIAHLKRAINRLHAEIGALREKCESLKESNTEADLHGQQVTLNASDRIKDLEKALNKAKVQMAKQIRDYQDLMNLKMTLDIEISTYKKLLEGEESRMANLRDDPVISIQAVPIRNAVPQQRKPSPVILKTTETNDRYS